MKLPSISPVLIIPAGGLLLGYGFYQAIKFRPPNFDHKVRVPGRTVIVTGASSGLGKAVAGDLALRGARVIMACRDINKCERVRDTIIEHSCNKQVVCKKLELTSFKSVREFAQDIIENEKRVDVLINNAGVMGTSKLQVTQDGIEHHLQVNCLAPFLLTRLLKDKLIESAPSRVVNIATPTMKLGDINFQDLNQVKDYSPKKAYNQSKLGLAMNSLTLAEGLQGTGISVFTVIPPSAKTEIFRELPMNKSIIGTWTVKPFFNLTFRTAQEAAQSIIYCALEPSISTDTGKIYRYNAESTYPENVLSDKLRYRFWLVSDRWTQERTREQS